MKRAVLTIPEQKFYITIYKDPSYSERWPWVVRVNGGVINNGVDREDAIALAKNWVEINAMHEMNTHVDQWFKETYKLEK